MSIKIAVLAKSHQDFENFLKEMYASKNAVQIFVYVEDLHRMRGCQFDAVIETDEAWKKPANEEILFEILKRIRN
jgi:phage terminase large subunit-like protein